MRNRIIRAAVALALLVPLSCGGESSGKNNGSDGDATNNGSFDGANNGQAGGTNNGTQNGNNDVFVPEVEEFVIRSVAATDNYVFVPNASEEGNTVARIDGRDLSVTPIPVGLRPTDVVAVDHPTGAIAVVLVEGTSSAAVIRADESATDVRELVHLLPVPAEVNRLTLSPDEQHVLAWIDPRAQLPDDSTVASLQAAALIRIGDDRTEDAAFELSVTRLIRDVEFTADGEQVFIVGREGVNRLKVNEVAANAFVPPLNLNLSDDLFPPTDLEVEVASDGSFLVARSSAYEGIALYELTADGLTDPTLVPLSGIPTDIDLYLTADDRVVLATVRDQSQIARIDVDDALAGVATAVEVTPVSGVKPGLAQITPDRESALLYSTLPLEPEIAVYELADASVRSYALRNKIRSVAVSPDSRTAVVVHERQEPKDTPELSFFQQNDGLTLFDIETGYRRPIVLQAEPQDFIMAETGTGGTAVFVLLDSEFGERKGIMRIDLGTYRTDFVPVVETPRQIGLVAGKVFVAQESEVGRITFFDVDTLGQRTVSGYELNAGID